MNSSPGWTAADLRRLLSQGRFDRYVQAAGSPTAAVDLYAWNIAISGAWYETLGMFEVVLRNALDRELSTFHRKSLHGNGRWWEEPQMPWHQGGQRTSRQVAQLEEARRRASYNGRRRPVHGKVVAELTMGFWTYLLTSSYQATLWAPALRHAFPHLRSPQRQDVHKPIDDLYGLRNRIAHHEPVHRLDHAELHRDLLKVAGWIDTAAAAWITESSRVPAVLADKP